jgi:hypothetical protein
MNAKSYRTRKKKSSAVPPAAAAGGKKPIKEFYGLLFIEEIHHRAETMTPLLKEILAFRPQPHWRQ